jgi:UPF0755 protein
MMMLREDPPPTSRASRGRARVRAARRRWRGITVLVTFTVVAVVAAVAVLRTGIIDLDPAPPAGQKVRVTIPDGASSRSIGRELEERGVVSSARAFSDEAAKRGVAEQLKPGQYQLTTGMDLDQLLEVLTKGPDATADRLVFPEGLTVAETAKRMVDSGRWTQKEVDAAFKDPSLKSELRPAGKPLEGLLFPATYPVQAGAEPVALLRTMLDELEETMGRQDFSTARRLNLTDYDVLIVASMVEREAKVDEDRPKIAQVIYNRMRAKERLQIDATVQYALKTSKALSTKDLQVDSPYNTYKRVGLPPTPIASPGEASIKAALAPADGDWRFYVLTDSSGRHAFTNSYEEFLRLKAEAKRKGLL